MKWVLAHLQNHSRWLVDLYISNTAGGGRFVKE